MPINSAKIVRQRLGISFEERIATAAMITALGVLLAACLVFSLTQWQAEARLSREARTTEAQLIANEIANPLSTGDLAAVRQTLEGVASVEGVRRVLILNPQGKLLFTSACPLGSKASETTTDITVPIQASRQRAHSGTLTLTATVATTNDLLARYASVFGSLFFVAAGGALFLSRWVARRAVEPVIRLSHVMEDVAASGDFQRRVMEAGDDEFGKLSRSFNALLHQLHVNDSDLRRTLAELVEAKDKAEAANTAKSQFLANMSHEIRTPLNGVITMAEIMAAGDLSAPQRKKLDVVRHSSAALLLILNDLLDLSKIEAGHVELLIEDQDLSGLLREMHDSYAPMLRQKGLEPILSLSADLSGHWRLDAYRLRQVISNLMSNALKFTDQGTITLGGRVEWQSQDEASIVLCVSDTGIGIPSEKIDRLFEKFVQVDGSTTRQYGGTGLGLAICRELVLMMGGKIWIESIEGAGSTFYVRVPLTRSLSASLPKPTAKPISAAPVNQHPRLKILAAEDVQANQMVLQAALEHRNIDLTLVDNGAQALEAFGVERFDLILMDIQMPVMDGLAATRAIRNMERQGGLAPTPIIALSANAMDYQIASYREAGCDDYIAKPIDLARLASAIDRLSQTVAIEPETRASGTSGSL
jgi:signal transduction histidine kinase/ActR/RegA family two-component response regulator